MGFYSFYKIVKDIFQTIFGRKLFKYILIVLCSLMLFSAFSKVSYGATINSSELKSNGDLLINYTVNLPDKEMTGDCLVPSSNLNTFITYYCNYQTCNVTFGCTDELSPNYWFSFEKSNTDLSYDRVLPKLKDINLNDVTKSYTRYAYKCYNSTYSSYMNPTTDWYSINSPACYIYSNHDTYFEVGDSKYLSYHLLPVFTKPEVTYLSDEKLRIQLNDFCVDNIGTNLNVYSYLKNITYKNFYFEIYDLSSDDPDYYWTKAINDIDTYVTDNVFEIPLQYFETSLGTFNFIEGHNYKFEFDCDVVFTTGVINTDYYWDEYHSSSLTAEHVFSTGVSVDNSNDDFNQIANNIIDSNNQTQNAINEQTEAIKEQNETSKGIWETIKEILSYLNPFSENFFGYKIVELIISGFQVLFDTVSNLFEAISNFISSFFSDDYDDENVSIDSNSSDNIDETNYTNFITALIDSVNNAVTGDWSTVEEVEIPFGIVEGNITYRSDMVSANIPNALKLIINTFWMFLFGMYIFKFGLNLVNWLKSGQILEGSGFTQDEVITSSML